MAITNHYWHCVREILHLLSSQLIIDFPFVHSEFVNDFMRVIRFFPPFRSPAGTLALPTAQNNLSILKNANCVYSSRKRDPCFFANTINRRDEFIKGQYVACIIIYLNQHLGKY